MSEKIWGKRAAADELAWKKRKTAGAASLKLGGISLGDDQTTRPRRTAVFDWSDDDEFLPAGLPSTKGPPLSAGAEDQSRGDKEIPKQRTREIPAQQTTEAPIVQTTRVPEQQGELNPEQCAERILEHQTK